LVFGEKGFKEEMRFINANAVSKVDAEHDRSFRRR